MLLLAPVSAPMMEVFVCSKLGQVSESCIVSFCGTHVAAVVVGI